MSESAAHGSVLKISDHASTPAFTAIAGITSGPDGFGYSQSFVEGVAHDSSIRKKKASFTDLQPLTFEIFYDSSNTQHAALHTAAKTKLLRDFQWILTDDGAEQVAFSAWVDFTLGANPEDFNKASISLTLDPTTGVALT